MQNQDGRRLVIVGAILIVVGLVAAAAAHPALAAPIGIMGDAIFWPVDGLPGAPAEPLERLFAAVAGGLMAGWGAMFVAFGRGASIGRALVAGAIAWFVVDSTGSAMAGVPLNIAGNVPFLALMLWAAWPLAGGLHSNVLERGSAGPATDP